MTRPDDDCSIHPIAGPAVADVVIAAKSDLSDWVELMEVVEALCPVWPPHNPRIEGRFKM